MALMSRERDEIIAIAKRLPHQKLQQACRMMQQIEAERVGDQGNVENDEYAYLDDPDYEMDPQERSALDAAIAEGEAEIDAGLGIPAEQVLGELRAR